MIEGLREGMSATEWWCWSVVIFVYMDQFNEIQIIFFFSFLCAPADKVNHICIMKSHIATVIKTFNLVPDLKRVTFVQKITTPTV